MDDARRCPVCMVKSLYIIRQTWSFPIIDGIKIQECFLETKCDKCNKTFNWKLVSEES